MTNTLIRTLAICAAMTAAGCMETGDGADFSSSRNAIRGGQAASDETYASVVSIAVRANDMLYPYCSGVLIAPDIVLTAAHCLDEDSGLAFEKLYADGLIVVAAGARIQAVQDAKTYPIDQYRTHPDYAEKRHDLGVIYLAEEATGVAPAAVYSDKPRLKSLAYYKQPVEFAGYGNDEDGKQGVRLVAAGVINHYCAWTDETDCGYHMNSGDYIIAAGGSFVHDIAQRGPCNGDSGGPVFIDMNGQKYVIGIISSGDTNCAIYSASTSTADHYDWIEDRMNRIEPDDGGCAALPLKRNAPFQRQSRIFMLICPMLLGIFRRQALPHGRHG